MSKFKVTTRPDQFSTTDETVRYEGNSIWSALTVCRKASADKTQYFTLWTLLQGVYQPAMTGIDGEFLFSYTSINRLLPYLFSPPNEDEEALETCTTDLLVSVLDASGMFGHIEQRNDGRHNEIILGVVGKDHAGEVVEKIDTNSIHVFASTLIDRPESE